MELEVKNCSVLASKTLHLLLVSSSPANTQGQLKTKQNKTKTKTLSFIMHKFSILIYFSSYSHVAFWLELSGLLLYSHDNISISPSWRRVGKSQSTAQEACFDPTSYSLSHEKVVLLGNLSHSSLNSWATFAVLFWLLMCFNQELVSFLCDCEQHSSLFKVFAMLHPPPHNFYNIL